MYPKDPAKKALTFWLDSASAVRLEAVAREKKISQAKLLRDAVHAYLADEQLSKTHDEYLQDAIVCIERAKAAPPQTTQPASPPAPIWA